MGSARTVANMLTCYIQQQVNERHTRYGLLPGNSLQVDATSFVGTCRPHVQSVLHAYNETICHTAAVLAEYRLARIDSYDAVTLRVRYEGTASDPLFAVTVHRRHHPV